MSKHAAKSATKRVRSGRRFAADISQPRDRTLGIMVSEDEKKSIDLLAAMMGVTRSSFLAKISIAFVEDCLSGSKLNSLEEIFGECRIIVEENENA